jgi:multiple sugar transport system substrate-binding protein
MSEFDADAVKLTKSDGDGYSELGFMPNYHGYESSITHFSAQWSPTYFADDGTSNVANDPAFAQAMEWQKGPGRQARWLRQAREVPLHVR